MRLSIQYSPDALEHLRALARHEQVRVLDAVLDQLSFEPVVETRNRKPMRPNPVAPWELRVGPLRVYYDVREADGVVSVLAIGTKDRASVRIGGEVVEL